MTANQINYLNYLESKRHNLRTEGLTATDVETRRLQYSESLRSNLASEEIRRQANSINALNAQASLQQASAAWYNAETNRQNVANNYALGLEQNKIAALRNSDLYELDLRRIALEQQQQNTNAMNAQTNALNANVNQQNALTRENEFYLNELKVKTDINLAEEKLQLEAHRTGAESFKDVSQGVNNFVRSFGSLNSFGG